MSSNTPLIVSNADEAIVKVVSEVLQNGSSVKSVINSNSKKSSIELENFQFSLNNPLDRIAINREYPLNVIGSVGRFVWLIAGNDRMEDIAFYQAKVKEYSDNGFTIPGSDYGKRIFNPIEGVDQVTNIINLLRKDPNSRRAIIPIWSTNDSTRLDSKDIPCAFGLSFIIRDNTLHTTLMMRSNNALRLLPVNIFEFSLIGEIVARELDIEYAQYTHYSISMHIFEDEIPIATKWINLSKKETYFQDVRCIMPPMPKNESALEKAKELARLEASLRNESVLKNSSDIFQHLENASKVLKSEYWYEFYKVLAVGALVHANEFEKAERVASELKPYFKNPVLSHLLKIKPKQITKESLDQYLSIKSPSMISEIKNAFRPDNEEANNIIESLEHYSDIIEKKLSVELTAKEWRKLAKGHLNKVVIAARSTEFGNNPDDLRKISLDEVEEAIKKIISERV